MDYEFLEHTADAKFKAYGDNLEQAFMNAAYAMFHILKGEQPVKKKSRKTISLEASSEKALLHDFLSEFLFLIDTESLILSEIASLKMDGLTLECEAFFDKAEHYETTGDIKSVTYSEMEITKRKEKVTVQVVVDI